MMCKVAPERIQHRRGQERALVRDGGDGKRSVSTMTNQLQVLGEQSERMKGGEISLVVQAMIPGLDEWFQGRRPELDGGLRTAIQFGQQLGVYFSIVGLSVVLAISSRLWY